jgi:hypothetical protein
MRNSHKNLLVWNHLLEIRTKFWWNSHWMVLFQKCVCAAISVRGRDHQTQFWKRTIQWLFYQSLVPIEQLVPDKKILCEFPIGSSGSHVLSPRWQPQCSCIVIESSFDPGERLQAPGSLWFILSFTFFIVDLNIVIFHFWDLHFQIYFTINQSINQSNDCHCW